MGKKFQAKLKLNESEEFNNIFVSVKGVEFKTSKKGWKFAEVTVGDYVIILDAKYVHKLDKNEKYDESYSVGIKDNFKYQIKDVKATVKGADLIQYNKNIYNELNTKEETKTETTAKKAKK